MLEKKIQSFWIHFFFMNQICYKSPPNQPEKSVEKKLDLLFVLVLPFVFTLVMQLVKCQVLDNQLEI